MADQAAAAGNVNLNGAIGDIAIPVRPQVIIDLTVEKSRDEPDFARIQKLVMTDVGMSAAMLKAANSPMFGQRSRVTGISQAIQLLGLNTTLSVAMSVAMRQAMKGSDPVALERFWDTAEAVGTLCAALARRLRAVNADEAYTYGLFHDCGIPLLTKRFPNYKDVLRAANAESVLSFTDVEDAAISTNHAVVGHYLARSWLLSGSLCEAITSHHDLDAFTAGEFQSSSGRALIAIGHCAEHIHHLRKRGSEELEWLRLGDAALDYLGLGHGEFDDLCDELAESA